MGILNFINRFIDSKNNKPLKNQISNKEYQQIRQNEEDFWEQKYDLSTVEGINSIPLPTKKSPSTDSVTSTLDYYLIRKAGIYENSNQPDLAIACYKKANEIMSMSSFIYPKERYLCLPRYLRKLRRFDEARIEEDKIERYFANNNLREQLLQKVFSDAKLLNTDLVEAAYSPVCCSECAKYRNRIYSISGKDKRFPKLPDILLDISHDCNITLFTFIYGYSSFYNKNGRSVNPIEHSNRAFIDDRTPEEKEAYKNRLTTLKKQKAKELNSKEYDWILEHMPEDCPKSLSGYTRMKNSNSDNYKKLVLKAKEKGFIING